MESVAAIAPAGDRSVYNYENGNEIKKIDYTSGQKDVPYYDIVIKSPDENVLIKAELDDKFLTEVEKNTDQRLKKRGVITPLLPNGTFWILFCRHRIRLSILCCRLTVSDIWDKECRR